jgi:ABC-type uncharacterized transport system involved in gliding motility auxiliary subunit
MLDELTTTSYFAVSTDSMLDVMLFMCIPGNVGWVDDYKFHPTWPGIHINNITSNIESVDTAK